MNKKKNKKEDVVVEDKPLNENKQEETTNESDKPEGKEENSSEEDKIAKLEKELKDQKDQNLRLYAEFENFRRRTAKERIELFSTANEELMTALLPVLDDFDRAIKNLSKNEENSEVLTGVELIYSKLFKTLENKNLKAIESTHEKEFNAEHMEAITKLPAPNPEMAGKVIDEVERGYMLGNKIIRFPKVVVGEKVN